MFRFANSCNKIQREGANTSLSVKDIIQEEIYWIKIVNTKSFYLKYKQYMKIK